jgi:hypothetical protein
MAEHERRQLDEDRDKIMVAVKDAIDASVRFAILEHTNQCAVVDMKVQHDRMYKELFNGDDGQHGFVAEGRNFFNAWYTRTNDEDSNKSKRKWRIGTAILIIGIVLAAPIQDVWRTAETLRKLADEAPDIIKLTQDWKSFYSNPPVHQMEPAPIITPPDAQTSPKKKPPPRKKKDSFFEYEPGGVGLLHAPPLSSSSTAHY